MRSISPWSVVTYCVIISSAFVLNLYILVPTHVRCLPRNDPKHIRWRIVSVSLTTLLAMALQPFWFGEFVGYSYSFALHLSPTALSHVLLLYLGPMAASVWKTHSSFCRWSSSNSQSIIQFPYLYHYWTCLVDFIHEPFQTSHMWCGIRDLLMAPLTEELVFRCCVVPPFLKMLLHSSNYHNPFNSSLSLNDSNFIETSIRKCCFITPLFFGLAHLHHALVKYHRDKTRLNYILLETFFQFTYTSIFGAYVSWVLCTTSSWINLVFIHSFCNFMGLPNVSFFWKQSPPICNNDKSNRNSKPIHGGHVWMKTIVGFFYLIGLVAFYQGFDSKYLLFPTSYTLIQFL